VSALYFVYTKVVFEWDKRKAERNKDKHGVDFDEAASCFLDPQVWMLHDLSHSGARTSEDRYMAIARSDRDRILIIVFTLRKDEDGKEKFRIISARRASKKERKSYPR
jgi:uncharacterized protein